MQEGPAWPPERSSISLSRLGFRSGNARCVAPASTTGSTWPRKCGRTGARSRKSCSIWASRFSSARKLSGCTGTRRSASNRSRVRSGDARTSRTRSWHRYSDRLYRMPIHSPHVRSLNLTCGIALYEVLKQRFFEWCYPQRRHGRRTSRTTPAPIASRHRSDSPAWPAQTPPGPTRGTSQRARPRSASQVCETRSSIRTTAC